MTQLRKGGPIRLGDKLIHGGRVLSVRHTTFLIYNLPVAHRGDMAQCEKHGGLFPFVEGCYGRSSYGSGMVLDGHRLACGCYAISSCAGTDWVNDWLPPGLGTALEQAHTDGNHPLPSSRWTPPPLPDNHFALPGTQAHPLVMLRIGLFFDGTGNNADNATLSEQCRATPRNAVEGQALAQCKAYMTNEARGGHAIDGAGSYGNAVSNISRLFELYQDSTAESDLALESGDTYVVRLYVEGIGTQAGEKDSTFGMATGEGSTGIIERVGEALTTQLHELLRTFSNQYQDAWVTDIIFDVFGFSRGAAAARHALNQVKHGQRGPLARAIAPSTLKLAPGFDWSTHIRVGFAGLYDTVAHVGHFTGNPKSLALHTGIDICLREACADAVVHLTARDEHRLNFPLTSAAPPWQDIPLPGAHADVGGGYQSGEEDVLLTQPALSEEAASTPLERTQAWNKASKHLAALRQANPALADKIDIYTWLMPSMPKDALTEWIRGPSQWVGAAVRLRHMVSNAYALVTLRIMHALAQDKGVPWLRSPDDIPVFTLPDQLQSITTKLLACARGGTYDLSSEEERTLEMSYIHYSANWNMLLPDDSEHFAILYINRPTENGERVIFPNQDTTP